MEHELNEELFVLGLHFVEVELTIDVSERFDLAKLNEMLCHVSSQHCLNDNMSASLKVLSRHMDGPVAGLVLGHEGEGGGEMVVLEHADIVVSHCNLIIHVDEEDVIDSGVLEVVKRRRNDAAHLL